MLVFLSIATPVSLILVMVILLFQRDKLKGEIKAREYLEKRFEEHEFSKKAHIGPLPSWYLYQERNGWIKNLRLYIAIDKLAEQEEQEQELSKLPDSLIQQRCAELKTQKKGSSPRRNPAKKKGNPS